MSTPEPKQGVKRHLGKVLLGVWLVLVVVGMASMSVSHMVAMPTPNAEARLSQAALGLRRDSTAPFLVHVIYAGCSCTNRLFAHLIKRGRFSGTEETILFVGEDRIKQKLAEQAGFGFKTIPTKELTSRFGLESAPVLIAFDAAGQLKYVGGYYDHPATISPRDERLHEQIAKGASPSALPVFGCAVSAKLQRSVDPLGIVYSKP